MGISKKGKRELEYDGKLYYWYIKKDENGFPKIHIMSDDKKLQLVEYFDKELPISSDYIKNCLRNYFAE